MKLLCHDSKALCLQMPSSRMLYSSPILFLLVYITSLQTIAALYTSTTSDIFLFYTSPASGSYRAGLYGGQVAPILSVEKEVGGQPMGTMRQFGYDCYESTGRDAAVPDQSYLNDLRSVSYDQHTGRVLLFSDKSSLNLVSVPACRRYRQQCANKSNDDIKILLNNFPHSKTVKPGPFASHGAQLYFLLERTDNVVEPGEGRSATIELRRVNVKCHNAFPITAYTEKFDWLGNCTEILAVLSEEKNVKHLSYRAMDSILLIDTEDEGRRQYLDLYMQMQQLKQTSDGEIEAVAILYHVRVLINRPIPKDSLKLKRANVLHRQPINSGHVKYLLYHMGGLTFKQGHLCWTAVEMILCGRVEKGGEVKDVKSVIGTGDIERVCTGTDSLNTVVTGVALADVTFDQLTLYFGCWSQTGGDSENSVRLSYGGAGVAKVHLGSGVKVERVREPPLGGESADGSAVLGSGMFLTQCERHGVALAEVTSAEQRAHTTVHRVFLIISAVICLFVNFVVADV